MKFFQSCLLITGLMLILYLQQAACIFFGKGGLGGGAQNSETYYAQPLKKHVPARRAPSVKSYKVILKSAPQLPHVQTFKVIHIDKSQAGYSGGGAHGCAPKW